MLISCGKRINLGGCISSMGALDRRGPTTTLTITQLTVWRPWTVFCSVVKNALLAAHFLSRGGSRGRVQGCAHTPPPRDDLGFPNTTGILQNMAICMICILSSSYYVIA